MNVQGVSTPDSQVVTKEGYKQYRKEQIKRRWCFTFYGSKWFSFPQTYKYRLRAYKKHFRFGEKPYIEHNVILQRVHGFIGKLSLGDNVVLTRDVFIDYSGEVIIKSDVRLASGVIIESHHRDLEAYALGEDKNIPTRLVIEEGAYIGLRAIILSSCNYIGKFSRIGAGAVVTKDVPDYATVVGIPAKVVKINDPGNVNESR